MSGLSGPTYASVLVYIGRSVGQKGCVLSWGKPLQSDITAGSRGPEALGKLAGGNGSRPFDDDAALVHLRDVDGELVEADATLIDMLLRQAG